MHPPIEIQSTDSEARISLAIQASDRGQIQSNRLAAKTYKVDRTTLKWRREGITSRRDSTLNNFKTHA
ncbi:hypothetical protein LIPSTDRAFT_335849 [Lipomyces starkeyi NRRL Y-11557]|uniref:HTH psq-type domain-containing protein n=1 Tax=Lipomyces starkeyi NRRL Y-11557 TaxID=675824 RepID=A0A1E3PTN7_LIPST|nr:hypothetical protein LIPSTDRAFT_335849 [Lipomyces starkeyi NRRL Y-11557]